MMHNYIIAYDIFDIKRLRKVKNIAYSYALGGQKSAVEAPLDSTNLKQLVRELKSIIEDDEQFYVYFLSEKEAKEGVELALHKYIQSVTK